MCTVVSWPMREHDFWSTQLMSCVVCLYMGKTMIGWKSRIKIKPILTSNMQKKVLSIPMTRMVKFWLFLAQMMFAEIPTGRKCGLENLLYMLGTSQFRNARIYIWMERKNHGIQDFIVGNGVLAKDGYEWTWYHRTSRSISWPHLY